MLDVTLLTKPGCHLCDDARGVVEAVVGRFTPRIALTEHSILEDPSLAERYAEEIPVVLIDGRQHAQWRVDADRFAAALERALTPRETP